jgi:hypothetical protein
VNVSTSGLYELWLAGSAPGQEDASPLQWRLTRDGATGGQGDGATVEADSSRPLAPSPPRPLPEGAPYAPGLTRTRLGSARLDPGRYQLTLAVSERSGDRFLFRVDALLFAREPFRPDGIRKPTWRVKTAGEQRR